VGEDLEQMEEDLQQLKTDIIEQAVDDTRKRSTQDEVFQSMFDRVFYLEVQLGTMVFESKKDESVGSLKQLACLLLSNNL